MVSNNKMLKPDSVVRKKYKRTNGKRKKNL